MVLSKENSTLFSLLRHAIWQNREEERIDFDLTTQEWQRLIENAASMGVLAIAFDALPKGEAFPGLSKELMIRWGLSVQRLEDRNRRQREALRELIDTFRENQIAVLLLKGLGLAENYPLPAHRECGDLDIYLFGDYEKGNQVIEALGIEVDKECSKHSSFFFKGIHVENHLSFLNLDLSETNINLEVHLHRILKEQGYETIMIDDITV
ncbi:MAG TPA: nucleotidyltransferase family protein, partial [Prolixibacteraceae bacterium]